MNTLCFFRSFFFVLVITLIMVSFPCWAGNSDDEITSQLAKTSISKSKKTQPPPHPTHLVRVLDSSPLVRYTQQLAVQGVELDLNRDSATALIDYVWKSSLRDGKKTHLLAQGFCRSETKLKTNPFTVTENFLGVLRTSTKKMVWVSQSSNAVSNNDAVIRKSTEYGGHAESQFISDLKAAFTQNSDVVVKKFLPRTDNDEDVYMCGVELFGSYDMCDDYAGEGKNKYNCVGKLKKFRIDHQEGQQSISRAIRDKLGDRFKGEEQDAFVLIYHAKYPYDEIDTYQCEDEAYYYPLDFSFKGPKFSPRDHGDFSNTFVFSQHESLSCRKNVVYGYIHDLADKKLKYTPEVGFRFH
jgi:hypothetical protein